MKAVTFEIEHNIEILANKIELILNSIMLQYCLSEQMLFEIKVVLNELIVNALYHGNNCDPEKVVFVTFKLLSNDNLYISIKDQGNGFKPKRDSVCEYAENNNMVLCVHGRGLLIVEKLCYAVKFNNHGNKISVLKKLN